MADLFEPEDLASYLQREDLDVESTLRARRIASGWLRSATRLPDWPSPVPDDLFGWALELAAMAYSNPEGLAAETIGGAAATWQKGRRAEILAEARSAYGAATAGGTPLYSFPEPDWSWTATSSPLC